MHFNGFQFKAYKRDFIKPYFNHKKYPIFQYDLKGNFLKKFKNIDFVRKEFPNISTHIYSVINGTRKSTAGYIWKDFYTKKLKLKSKSLKIHIYYYKNLKNNMLYIGQTAKSLKSRAGKDGKNYFESSKIFQAIQTFGWNSFEGKIIKTCFSQEEADFIENQLINKYDTVENGYNLMYGGQQKAIRKASKK